MYLKDYFQITCILTFFNNIIQQKMTSKFLEEFQNIYSKIKMSQNLNVRAEQDVRIKNQEQLKEQIIQTLTISEQQSINKKNNVFTQDKPQGYKVIQETQNMLLCVKQGQSRIYLTLSINSNAQLQKIVNLYIQQKQWNSAVATELIQQVEEPNNLQAYRQYNKVSFFSFERATFTKIKVVCTKNSAVIIQESQQTDQVPLETQRTLCKTKVFSKFTRCLGGIKLIMDVQFDAKGYCSTKDSLEMLVKLTNDLKYFENNFKILQFQKNKINTLIRSQVDNCTIKMIKKDTSDESSQQTSRSQDIAKYNKQSKQRELFDHFLEIRPKVPQTSPTEEFVTLFKNGLNEQYYLKQFFSQSNLQQYDKYLPYYNFKNIIESGKEYRITQNNELEYINYDMINGQKESLKFIVKQIGGNILSGKSAFNVSMPVDIFQSRSLLQREAVSYGFLPSYLCPMAEQDVITQMKNVIAFIIQLHTLQLFMQKPFNPILGQTFQAYIMGIPVYFEQISHHPPISAYYMKCDEFTLYGNLIAAADIGLNSATGGNDGLLNVVFKNGNHFKCFFPPCQIGGLIFGKRTFKINGRAYFYEQKSRIYAEINAGNFKKGLYDKQQNKAGQGQIYGAIFKVKKEFLEQVQSKTYSNIRKFGGINKGDVQEKICSIKGLWFDDIIIDDQVINKDKTLYPIQYPAVALPSDANFRLDILYHKMNNLQESQRQKEVLQTKQRADRKLRQKYLKSLKKK